MHDRTRGFSVVEFVIVVLVLLIVIGAIFRMMAVSSQRSSVEQAKLDMFQEAREFMDQMSRDLRQTGYPSPLDLTSDAITTNPAINDTHAAAGLVKVDAGELWFEGDVQGDGTVSVVHYWLDTGTTNNCPCLKRSQLAKITGDPLTGQSTPVYQTEVQGVQNTNIFLAYIKAQTGTPLGLPLTINSDANTIAGIDTVEAVLTVQSKFTDPQTKVRPINTLTMSVKLNNCSQAAKLMAMSCFY